ncbi:polycystin-1-like protein 1 [Halichoerus grypus]
MLLPLGPGPHYGSRGDSLGHSGSASWPRPKQLCPLAQCHPGAISVQVPADTVDPAIRAVPDADAQAPPSLGFRGQVASQAALCLVMDFGDSSGVPVAIRNVTGVGAVTAYHQFGKEGVYVLKACIYNEFCGTEKELGPYYVEIGPATVSVFMNSSSIHKDGLLVFADCSTGQRGTAVSLRLPACPLGDVAFTSQSRAGGGQAQHRVTVGYRMQPVSVYTNGTVFATDVHITFLAVTEEMTPLEFVWLFGEGPPVKTMSRSIKKRLGVPQWYSVTVRAASGRGSVASEPHRIRTQRRIVANRLVCPSSALLNASVTFECRLNFGTDVTFLWDFGDGTVGPGDSSASHAYSREGQFTVQVLAFNDVSTTSLRKQLFIVREPCQPPPVKNMGPGKVQVWRSQSVTLGVTFESEILCDISRGLSYTWTFWNSQGWPVPLPPAVSTHRQTVTVPSYFLEPGNYTALARVQVEGSVVHSNYSVAVEVRARAPVSVISEGTHLLLSRAPSFTVVLTGSQSYDPDRPGAALSYHWTCTAASSPGHACFAASSARGLGAGAPSLAFPADSLSGSYDQFLVTLTVSSAGRNSSAAQVFLSPRPDSALRFVHISWVSFKDVFVNWNEELSFQAKCDECGEGPHLSYSWDLFLVNGTERTRMEVPFCRTVGLLGAAGLGAISKLPESSAPPTEPSWLELHAVGTPSSRELSPQTQGQLVLLATGKPSSGPAVGRHRVPAAGEQGSPGPSPPGSPCPSPSDFEAYYSDIQEAVPSRGRQPADWADASLPGAGPSSSADGGRGDGDNLLGPSAPLAAARPTLAVDWPKSPVGRARFHGYTSSGITGHTVTIKPFSLSPGDTYVLQASVASPHRLLGRAQLYVTLNPAPRDVACQVQPHRGLEAHTVFSVFCMSGRPDFRYEFSYQIGNASKRRLYHGRDSQYYSVLPAGEPLDDYKITVSTEITDGAGSRAPPCAVTVTVRPRFHGNLCLDEDTYNSSLKHLSTLQLMGSYTEVRNYITVMTRVLTRWAAEDRSPSCGQWSRIQDALISSVCGLPFADQEEMSDSVLMLRDLLRFPHKLSFTSAALILKAARALLAQSPLSGRLAVDEGPRLELILLVSEVLEAYDQDKPRTAGYLQEEGIKVISDLLLDGLSANREHQLHVSTGQMEFHMLLHRDLRSCVQGLGSVQVHFPAELAGQSPTGAETQSPCYVSRLVLFKKSPYPGGQAPGQIGQVVAPSLFSCSSRRPISRWRLREPMTVEFGEEDALENRTKMTFVLLRDRVNVHQFIGHSANPQESLHIRIDFSRPVLRAFPVMVLVRFSEKPTPSDFLVRKVYAWDEQTVHVYAPAGPLRDTSLGYLSLLDADYDRSPPNKYFAPAVNYTVRFQWVQCLFWEARAWKSASFSAQPGASPEKVTCSYDRLAPVSVARRNLNASFSVSDVSKWQSHPENLLPSILVVVFTILYALLVTKSRRVDRHEKKKAGHIFLQEDAPPGHQLYAVVVDTGFRSPARCSAKVYIVLCGENGFSEPRELYCPERPLFERNSRHTFVLSAPALLGPLRSIRLWHDSRGPSPAWYVSQVMVRVLAPGHGRSSLFPAECWLAASRQDGRVQRELSCLCGGLGFWKLLYSKFTEYLEDFHVWTSVYSQPSPSSFPHTARLTVVFALLCAYACLTALLTAAGREQLPWALGTPDAAAGSFRTGLLCTLLVSPGAQLLSLILRLSQEARRPLRRAPSEAAQGPHSRGRTADAQKTHECHSPSRCTRACGGAAGGRRAGCPCPEQEAYRADPGQQAPREKGTRSAVHVQAPSSGFRGLAELRWPRALLPWSGCAAWAVCGMVSVACGLGTAFLGYRFSPTQCARWLHLLTLSVLCCAFISQPLLVSGGRLRAVRSTWEPCCPRTPPRTGGPLEAHFPSRTRSLGSGGPGSPRRGQQLVWGCERDAGPWGSGRHASPGLSPQLGLGAAGFAWRRRDDPRFFTASLRAATEGLDAELEQRARPRASRAQEPLRVRAPRERPSFPAASLVLLTRWAPPARAGWAAGRKGKGCAGTRSGSCGLSAVTCGLCPRRSGQRWAGPRAQPSVPAVRPHPYLLPPDSRPSKGASELLMPPLLEVTCRPPRDAVGDSDRSGLRKWPTARRPAVGDPYEVSLSPAPGGAHSAAAPGAWQEAGAPRLTALPSPQMVAARQRARRLRWARPPSAAQLSVIRERTRRETRTRVALRDICMYTLMLLLHVFILCGRCSQDEYSLNQAIRNEFTRGAGSVSGGLRSVGDWWGWSLTTLLDGLHGGGASTAGPPGAQPGALGGKCYLLGTPVIQQLRDPSGGVCELPSPPSALSEDSPPPHGPKVGDPDTPSTADPAIQRVAPSGPRGCGARGPWVLSLGSTRPAAHAALSSLRASRWIDRSTRTVSVHFALYNPPTRLLSSVSLRAELLPAGGLTFSPLVESLAVFRSDSALWSSPTLAELAFLLLSLTHLCLQLCSLAEKGFRSYWRKPGTWLELAVVGAGLACHAASSHLATLAGEVTDHFHRGRFRGSMDLTVAASWNQRVTWLQGTLSFLLTLKFICFIGIPSTRASCSFLLRRSLAGICTAGLVGILTLAAHCHLRAVPPGTFADFSRGLLFRLPGRSQTDTSRRLSGSDLWALAWCCGALFTVVSTAWWGMLRGSLTTLARKRKSFQSQSLVSLADVTACVWGAARAWLGLERPQREEVEMAGRRNYYLDEVSDLLDELLWKIHGLSDSLQRPRPELRFGDTGETRAEGRPSVGVSA